MIIKSAKDLPILINWLSQQNEVAFDLETSGLNPRKDIITDYAFSNGVESFDIVAHEWNGTDFNSYISLAQLKPLMNMLMRKKLVTFNGGFDTRFIYHKFGLEMWRSIHADGLLAAHTLDENKFNYQLKTLAKQEFGESAVSEQQDLIASIKANGGGDKEYYKANADIRARYAIQDVVLTWKLWKKWERQLAQQDLTEFFQTEVMELYRTVTVKMETFGVPVDVPLLERSSKEITEALTALEDKIQAEIEPLLGDFHAWYLERKHPHKLSGEFLNKLASFIAPPNWPMTKTGGYSFSEADLKKAVKKGLLPPGSLKTIEVEGGTIEDNGTITDTQLERIKKGFERVPVALKQKVQLALLADSGVKYPFNILSKDHLKRLFFTKLNETALSHTDLGAPQVDSDFLDVMGEKYPWAKDLQIYNRLTKIDGSYITRILEEQEDGMFYPRFAQHKTVSGRYGSDIQQLPRQLEAGSEDERIVEFSNRIRKFFIAGEGFSFVDDDYESLEPHVFAHVSGDEGLRNIFRNNLDFYSTIAVATEGLEGVSADKKSDNYLGKVNKGARQKAKAYSLGIPYGLGGYALAKQLDIPQSQGERLVADYLRAYPDLANWMKSSKEFAVKNGYIRTETGRVRRFPGLVEAYKKHGEVLFDQLELWKQFHETPRTYAEMKELASKCRNYVNNARNVQIQGLGASIVNKACMAINKRLEAERIIGAYVCAQIHDQIVVRCQKVDADRVALIVQEAMEGTYKLSLALKAPPAIGTNFADAH